MEDLELGGRAAPSAGALRAPDRVLAHAVNPNVTGLVGPEIPIGAERPSDGCTRAAEAFHRRVRPRTDRRRAAIEAAHEALGRPEALVVTICGARYVPLLQRWLASCDDRGIEVRDRTIVIALDSAAALQVEALGLQAVPVDPDDRGEIVEADGFIDPRFAAVMLYKLLAVHDTLHVVPRLLFQDVDLLWFTDPLPELVAASREIDLQFMFDGPNPLHQPLYANAGFFFVVANDATRALFETALRNSAWVLADGGMQGPLNRVVAHFAAHNLVRVTVLDEARYLNGHLFNLESGVQPGAGDWRRDGVVLHYSWTADIAQKLEKLARFDLG